jgi:glycoprotein endo-alpha-1,2-mannosidase
MRSLEDRTWVTYRLARWTPEVSRNVGSRGAQLLVGLGILLLLVVGGIPLGASAPPHPPAALHPAVLAPPTSSGGAGLATYRIYQFGLNGQTVAKSVDFGLSGAYVSSVSETSSPGAFQLTWGPVNIGISRGVTTNSSFTITVQAYIPLNVSTVQLTFDVSGWTNLNLLEENTGTHRGVASTNATGPGEFLASAGDLELDGPLTTVVDSLHGAVSHQTYAFYYAWYDPPSSWEGGVNGTFTSSVTGTPVFGYYSSHNLSIIADQIHEAQSVGINAFLESWIPTQSFINESLGIVIPEATQLGFQVGLQYETNATLVQSGLTQSQALAAFVGQIDWYLTNFSSSPSLLRIDGVPVIFLWQADSYPASFWQSAFSQIRAHHAAYFIAEANGNFSDFSVFDGVDIYGVNFPMVVDGLASNFTGANFTDGTALPYWEMQWEAALHNKLWFAPAEPGFDDLNDPSEAPKYTPRLNGSVYKATWDLADTSQADGVTITSWNEWHEGSNIEPASSAPVPWNSPDQYLNLTQCEIDRFVEVNVNSTDTCSGIGGTSGQANSTQPNPPNGPTGGGSVSTNSPWALVAIAAAVGIGLALASVFLSNRVRREAPRSRASTRVPRSPPPKR